MLIAGFEAAQSEGITLRVTVPSPKRFSDRIDRISRILKIGDVHVALLNWHPVDPVIVFERILW